MRTSHFGNRAQVLAEQGQLVVQSVQELSELYPDLSPALNALVELITMLDAGVQRNNTRLGLANAPLRRTGNNQVILAVLQGQAAVAIFGGTVSDIRSLDRLPVGRFSGALQPGYGLVVTPTGGVKPQLEFPPLLPRRIDPNPL